MSKRAVYEFRSEEPLWYLKSVPYYEYLQSVHWRNKREKFLEGRELVCGRCGLMYVDLHARFVLWETKMEYTEEEGWEGEDYSEVESRKRTPRWHVHHKTYERLGEEKMDDLELLCSPCHNLEHAPKTEAAKHWEKILESGGVNEEFKGYGE